jgi:hypothetical protein
MSAQNPLEAFQWTRHPEAAHFIDSLVRDFLNGCPSAALLAQRMHDQTGARFPDWIAHIALNRADDRLGKLSEVGYQAERDLKSMAVFTHDGGVFPAILAWDGDFELAIKVESVVDFLAANDLERIIQGEPLSPVRIARICKCDHHALLAIERHGTRSFEQPGTASKSAIQRLIHFERFAMRERNFPTNEEGFAHADRLIDAAIADLGVDLTCDLWFAAERKYWQKRNRAAQAQYARQQKLGLGWANHDHHTYRSSRRNFVRLIAIWEKLGLYCRERFYAGREAGWGAQVMEQPITGIITFNDVDLSPDELMGDFAHQPLGERDTLGTVGLWCGLHGESFLQAGMHHLEAQFDFDALTKQLAREEGVKTMKPFTNFSYLRQAFTEGERWPVAPARIDRLLAAHLITPKQAAQFREQGAIGSHLENLQRNEGFKGFNQTGVSEIIAATDPRKHVHAGA